MFLALLAVNLICLCLSCTHMCHIYAFCIFDHPVLINDSVIQLAIIQFSKVSEFQYVTSICLLLVPHLFLIAMVSGAMC